MDVDDKEEVVEEEEEEEGFDVEVGLLKKKVLILVG